jgi:clan AA aspartic protease
MGHFNTPRGELANFTARTDSELCYTQTGRDNVNVRFVLGATGVGVTRIEGIVRGQDSREATVRFLVDSGATYTLLPHDVWNRIGLTPIRRMAFSLADGTTVERPVSECYIILPQGEAHTPVILGEPGDEALLGVVTLELLGFVLNPFTREFQPMRMLLA